MNERNAHLPEWTWQWAWRLFTIWSRQDLDARPLKAGERWAVVALTVPAAVRNYYTRPARRWLLARLPARIVAKRLEPSTHHWYRIPTRAAAEHVRLRFDVYPIDIGDHIRIERGKLTAVAYAGPDWSEIIFIMPTGEIEPDPKSPEMTTAWSRYWSDVR